MPSRKTLNEAYYNYTRQREEGAMDKVRENLHVAISRDRWQADIYREEAEKHLRRASRLGILSAMIISSNHSHE